MIIGQIGGVKSGRGRERKHWINVGRGEGRGRERGMERERGLQYRRERKYR